MSAPSAAPPTETASAPAAERRPARIVRRIEEIFFATLVLAMILLGLLPVLLRRVAAADLNWAEPLTRHMVLWIALFGAAAATRDRAHITIDAVTHFLPRTPRLLLRALTQFLTGGICGFLAWLSFVFVREERLFAGDRTAFLGIPEWWLTLALPVGFALLALRLLLAAGTDGCDAFRQEPPAGDREAG